MKKRFLVLPFLAMLALTGCSSAPAEETGGHIKMADANWDSIKFHNAVVGYIAETAYNYTWEEVPGSSTITYEALKTGDIDVYTEIWTDNIATYEEDKASGAIDEKGVNFGDAIQGLYVPRYVIEGDEERGIEALAPDLETIQDLLNYVDVFENPDIEGMGRIYGAIPGWMADNILRNQTEYYGLANTDGNDEGEPFEYFAPGSDAALAAMFTEAYEAGEPIVGYYWEPTWLIGKYDFVRLTNDEPFNADTFQDGIGDWPTSNVTLAVRDGFAEENTELDAFLSKYGTNSAMTSEALAYMLDTGSDYVETAKWFLAQHTDLVEAWLPAEDAEVVISSLN